MQGNTQKFIEEIKRIKVSFRFQTEWNQSDNTPVTKWCSLSINEIEYIFKKLDVRQVLDTEFDARKTRLEELGVAQLHDECRDRGLDNRGKKVCLF